MLSGMFDCGLDNGPGMSRQPSIFAMHDFPKLMSEIRFVGGEGNESTLDRFQAELGGPEFEVLALSIDRAGQDAVTELNSEIGIENLALHIDPSAKAVFALGVVGPAAWGSPEMTAFMRRTSDQD